MQLIDEVIGYAKANAEAPGPCKDAWDAHRRNCERIKAEIERLQAQTEEFRKAKLELDELESVIDRQTYDEHHKANFEMPDDAELHIVLTAKDERRLGRALTAMTAAFTKGERP